QGFLRRQGVRQGGPLQHQARGIVDGGSSAVHSRPVVTRRAGVHGSGQGGHEGSCGKSARSCGAALGRSSRIHRLNSRSSPPPRRRRCLPNPPLRGSRRRRTARSSGWCATPRPRWHRCGEWKSPRRIPRRACARPTLSTRSVGSCPRPSAIKPFTSAACETARCTPCIRKSWSAASRQSSNTSGNYSLPSLPCLLQRIFMSGTLETEETVKTGETGKTRLRDEIKREDLCESVHPRPNR